MDIHISLRFFASLAQRMPASQDSFAVSSGTTIGEVLSVMGISEEEAKLVFANKKRTELSPILNDGDRIGFFPAVGGG